MRFFRNFYDALRILSFQSGLSSKTMLRFIRIFIRAVGMFSRTFRPARLSGLHVLHQNGVRTIGNRITSNYLLNFKSWKSFLTFQGVYFAMMLSGSAVVLALYGTLIQSDISYIQYILSFLPSLDVITTTIIWLGSFSFGWTMLVYSNHWNEVSAILTGATDFTTAAANILAFVYVSNVSMWGQFVSVLVHSPADLFTTVVAKELILWFDLWEHGFWAGFSYLVSWIPSTTIHGILINTGTMVGNSFHDVVTFIGLGIAQSWVYIVDKMTSIILPASTPLFLVPVVTPIFRGIATCIAGTIIWWILRIFFGFPF